LLVRVLQLPLSLAHIGLLLNHWQAAHRTGKEKLAPPALTRLCRRKIGAPGDVQSATNGSSRMG